MRREATLEMAARMESLGTFQTFVSSFARDGGFGGDRISEIDLVVEEALVNVFKYAYTGGEGTVSLSCAMDEGRLVVTVADRGLPFDPLSVPAPDPAAPLEERPIGGLGIYLIRSLTDRVDYRREGDQNILTLVMSK